MFTGIVKSKAKFVSLEKGKLLLESEMFGGQALFEQGCSIAVSGVCLSLREQQAEKKLASFDLLAETVAKTNFKNLSEGSCLNLEPALQVGGGLDGHFVSGHVDGTSEVISLREIDRTSREVWFSLPESLSTYICKKGSVTINGVSLTVGEVEEGRFSVYLIPLTWTETNLGDLVAGDEVNIEVDLIARYVARILENRSLA